MLLSLWKYFHYQHLAVNFLQKCQYAQVPQGRLLIGELAKYCMRVTRHRLVYLLCIITRERSPKHWVYSRPSHQKSSLYHYLYYTMWYYAPLNLILQTGNGQLCLRDVKTYIHLTKSKLENLRTGETKWFEEEHFDDMACKAQSADTSFGWEHYVTDVFEKFLSIFIVQLDDAFEGLEFWIAFDIFDPFKLPEKKIWFNVMTTSCKI